MRKHSLAAIACVLLAAVALAGFSGSDVFLPMVGRQAGVGTSNWYTTIWIHNPGAEVATARIYFLERGTVNLAPPWVDVMIEPGDTDAIENIVDTLFHKQVFGALRVTCATQKLSVTSRVYSKAVGAGEKDSAGQDFAGVPASFAIGLNEKTQILGTYQTVPSAGSNFRYNFGFVETTGHTVTVRVRAFDGSGADQGYKDFQVREWSQRQVAFKDHFPTVSTENTRLEVEVISGAGKIIAYGSMIANASQDPTTFEMDYPPRVLAENATPGITGVTAGNGLTGGGTSGTVTLDVGAGDGISVTADGVSLASGGVTPANIQPSATAGQVLTTVASGSPAPGMGAMALAGNTVAWQTPANGDITAVDTGAGSGLTGGVTSGDANLAITAGGVANAMLAADAVTSEKILNGTVSSDDVGFNYAGSASKGGAASDLTCSQCVSNSEIAAGAQGQVLATNASHVVWQTPAGGDITAVNTGAGSGLSGGVTSGEANLAIAAGGVSSAMIANNAVSQAKLSVGPAISGWVLGTNGINLQWQAPTHGDITGVWGGSGLTGGASSGDVTLDVSVPLELTGSLALVPTISGSNDLQGDGVYGYSFRGSGVHGQSTDSYGVEGESDKNIAVRAVSSSSVVALQAVGQAGGVLIDAWTSGVSSSRRFRVDGTGNVYAAGTFNPGGADFAEMLPGRDGLEPGDVLAIGADGRLIRSVEAYQASVVGVYSTAPGVIGGAGEGQSTQGKVPLAVVGVVPVKVSAENGAIRPGDLLVAAATAGHAMKAGARAPAGAIIGKALGGLEIGAGTIEMLVMMR